MRKRCKTPNCYYSDTICIESRLLSDSAGEPLDVNVNAYVYEERVDRIFKAIIYPANNDFAQNVSQNADKKQTLEWMSAMDSPLASRSTFTRELSLTANKYIKKAIENDQLRLQIQIKNGD